jgi:Cys-Gly metallodipeptidase DUG1
MYNSAFSSLQMCSGSIPVTLTFQEALGKNVLLLPMGRSNDGAHSINEKLDKSNYLSGIKLMATYLHRISKQTT